MLPRTPFCADPWLRRRRRAGLNVPRRVPTKRAVPWVGALRVFGSAPSAICVGMARSSRAKASEDHPTAIKLLASCHRRQGVLMAEENSEPGAWSRVRATARSLDPSGPELLKTRLHTAYLTRTEMGPGVPPVREMERHARGSPSRALSRKERDSI